MLRGLRFDLGLDAWLQESYEYFILPLMSLEAGYALPLIRQAAQLYAHARQNLLEAQHAQEPQ